MDYISIPIPIPIPKAIDKYELKYGSDESKLNTTEEKIINYFKSNSIDYNQFKKMSKIKFSKDTLFKQLKIKLF